MEKTKEAEPSSASAYKKHSRQEWTIEVPSGFAFKVHRPNAVALLTKGVIPTRLYSAALEGTDLIAGAGNGKEESMKPEFVKGMLEFMGIYLSQAIIEPKTVLGTAKDEEISVTDLEEEDMLFLFDRIYNRKKEDGGAVPADFLKTAGSASA